MVEVALITGCATGIGRALAENLSKRTTKNGKKAFKVYATDYRLEAVKDLEELGMGTAQLDVTDFDSINAAVQKILAEEGRIDLLVCNAGMSAPGWITEMDYENVMRIFNVNVHGVFRVAQAVAPHMMKRRSGKIAVVASVNSWFVSPFNAAYSGTKATVAIMAEGLRLETEPFGIHVTTIVPGWVKSDILANSTDNWDRYEQPKSFFQLTIDRIREIRKSGYAVGCTTKEAANDIGSGLAKPKPRRYIYTGKLLYYALWWGFVQQWMRPTFLADSLIKRYMLPEAAAHAPRHYDGPYQENKAAVPNGLQKEE